MTTITISKLFSLADAASDAENYLEALNLFTQAAELGDGESQNNLGVIYDCGHGVPIDKNKAKFWYKKSIENGSVCARFNLATLMLDEGEVYAAIDLLIQQRDMYECDTGEVALALGKIYLDKLNDRKKAIECLNLAIKHCDLMCEDSVIEAKACIARIGRINEE